MDSMVNRYTSDRRIRSDDAYTPRRRRRRAARPLRHRLRAALPRGVPGRADRDRRHRGEPAPHRALRLLVGEGAPLGAARRQGRPAGLRQRRAADLRDRAPARGGRADRGDRRPARHGVRAQGAARGLDRDRLDHDRHAGPLAPPVDPYAMEPAAAIAQRSRERAGRRAVRGMDAAPGAPGRVTASSRQTGAGRRRRDATSRC